jgi:hypothetical protein
MFKMLRIKRNHGSLKDMLLQEAMALEEQGCFLGSKQKLGKALNADKIQDDSLQRIKDNYYSYDIYPATCEFMYSWPLEEDVDWSDSSDFKSSLYVRNFNLKRRGEKKEGALLPG